MRGVGAWVWVGVLVSRYVAAGCITYVYCVCVWVGVHVCVLMNMHRICPSCDMMNFASRMACRRCNLPKPHNAPDAFQQRCVCGCSCVQHRGFIAGPESIIHACDDVYA